MIGRLDLTSLANALIKSEADRIFDRYINQLLLRAAMHSQRMFEQYSPAERQTILREMRGAIRRTIEPNRNVFLGEHYNTTPKNYSKAGTEAALSALVELGQELEPYRDDIVLIGGLSTYLVTKGFFNHRGSNDIDLAIRAPTLQKGGKTIHEIIASLGYEVITTPPGFVRGTPSGPDDPWRFFKMVIIDDKECPIELQFVCEWPGITPIAPSGFVSHSLPIQDGLVAEQYRDMGVALIFNLEKEIEAVLPNNRTEKTTFRVVDLAGLLALKITSGRSKDYYDIFALTHCNGGPLQAAESFKQLVSGRKKVPERYLERLETSLKLISCEFKNEWSIGANSVKKFDKKQKADVVAKQVTQFVESASQVRNYCQTCLFFNHTAAACFLAEF